MEAKTKNPNRQVPHRTKAKRNALKLLADYFCLTTNDVAALMHPHPTATAKASTRRTLRLLHRDGLVNRLPYYDLDIEERSGKTFVYGLSDKGLTFIDRWDIWDQEADFKKTFDEHSARTLDHELEIAYFHIALKKLCLSHGLELSWMQAGLKKKTIAPDAYFAITDPKKPQGKNTLHYFLEVERAKIGNFKNGESSIMRKLGKYYDYYDTDQCEKDWYSFRRFRVIVTLRNDIRRGHLLEELAAKYPNRMFWLATEEDAKKNIGSEIFRTPKDYSERSYSFLTQ